MYVLVRMRAHACVCPFEKEREKNVTIVLEALILVVVFSHLVKIWLWFGLKKGVLFIDEAATIVKHSICSASSRILSFSQIYESLPVHSRSLSSFLKTEPDRLEKERTINCVHFSLQSLFLLKNNEKLFYELQELCK